MSVRQGNREKGWNDPPEFLHVDDPASPASAAGAPGKRLNILNQRVAHSLDGGVKPIPAAGESATLAATDAAAAPPKQQVFSMPPAAAIIAQQQQQQLQQQAAVDGGEPNVGEISIGELEACLSANVQHLKDNQINTRTCDDILKRVKVFVTNWPKLNDKVKIRMHNLTKALERSELKLADDLHVKLMLDYPSEVSLWMVGIKKLIHELISLNEAKKKKDEEAAAAAAATEASVAADSSETKTDS